MSDTITAGTVFVKEHTELPWILPLKSESDIRGWQIIQHLDAYGLDRKIRDAGWNFFYLAGEIKSIAFGFSGPNRLRKAVQRILARPDMKEFNALEITEVNSRRLLGFPCVSVSAHARNFQESMVLFPAKAFRNSRPSSEERPLDPVPAFATTIHARPEGPIIPLSWDNNSTTFEGAFR